jgi:hypothetical protein
VLFTTYDSLLLLFTTYLWFGYILKIAGESWMASHEPSAGYEFLSFTFQIMTCHFNYDTCVVQKKNLLHSWNWIALKLINFCTGNLSYLNVAHIIVEFHCQRHGFCVLLVTLCHDVGLRLLDTHSFCDPRLFIRNHSNFFEKNIHFRLTAKHFRME